MMMSSDICTLLLSQRPFFNKFKYYDIFNSTDIKYISQCVHVSQSSLQCDSSAVSSTIPTSISLFYFSYLLFEPVHNHIFHYPFQLLPEAEKISSQKKGGG